jgi:sec-independent protein translocase protein TatA
MFDIGTREIIIIAVVLVVLFGAKKIPELANGIAQAVSNLRKGFGNKTDKPQK